MKTKQWFTASEFAKVLGRTRQWTFLLIRSGNIQADSFGGMYKIHKSQLEKIKKLLQKRIDSGMKNIFSPRRKRKLLKT